MSFQESPTRESITLLNGVPTTTATITTVAIATTGETKKDESIVREFSLGSINSNASQEEQYLYSEHSVELLVRMEHYMAENQLCDVVLIAGIDGVRIPAHRLVLSASSAYFSAMFTGSLIETQQKEITLGGVKGDVLQYLIKYCYSGRIDIRENNVESLLAAASLFQLNTIVSACSNFLAKQLHPSNCLGFALFAEQQNCKTLLELAKEYTDTNFLQVCKNAEFFLLDEKQLANVLKSDFLNVKSEQEVFQALLAWIHHDSNRKKYIPELLSLIRLPLIQPAFIADHVESVCNTSDCQKLILEALKWHVLPERRSQNANDRTRPRHSTIGRLLAIGGLDAQKGAICIESYCPRLNVWSLFKHMSVRRFQYGVALIEDKLIFVGGRDGLKTLNSVECLDLQTLTVTPLGPMNTHRHGLSVVVLEGPLYAVGGHDGWTYLNTVERWDPIARTWSNVAPMSSMRSTAAVAVMNKRLYVVGGRDSSGCHRSVECYDPHTNKWTLRAPMNKRRGSVAVAALNGYLYALGGNDSPAINPYVCRTETVERYDQLTDTWTLIASLKLGRDAIGAASFGGSLIAVGGFDGDKYHKTVEQYNPETQKWTNLAPLNFCRSGFTLIEIPNHFPETPRV